MYVTRISQLISVISIFDWSLLNLKIFFTVMMKNWKRDNLLSKISSFTNEGSKYNTMFSVLFGDRCTLSKEIVKTFLRHECH